MRPVGSRQNFIDVLSETAPSLSEIDASSPYCSLHRTTGALEIVEKTITGNAGEVATDLFSFTGAWEIDALYLYLSRIGDITTLSGVYLDVWDGANSVPVTGDGLDMSGAGLGAFAVKSRVAANPLTLLDSDQARYGESVNNNRRAFIGGLVVPKNGVTNYLRLRAGTDANTDVDVTVGLTWTCREVGDEGPVEV